METNIAELRVYIREKPTDEACCARGGGTRRGWRRGGREGGHHRAAVTTRERECKYALMFSVRRGSPGAC